MSKGNGGPEGYAGFRGKWGPSPRVGTEERRQLLQREQISSGNLKKYGDTRH